MQRAKKRQSMEPGGSTGCSPGWQACQDNYENIIFKTAKFAALGVTESCKQTVLSAYVSMYYTCAWHLGTSFCSSSSGLTDTVSCNVDAEK
ncbi:hypothetical protein STEG23_035915 [Scotinomys teguina]